MKVQSRYPNVIRRLMLFSFFCLCIFATIEICARIDDWFRYSASILGPYNSDQLRMLGADGNQYNAPNARFEKWHNNSYGFRGEEISIEKPNTTIRIVCLGSSETYGLYESPGNEWPSQLQKRLPRQKYQVINAGMPGNDLRNYMQYFLHSNFLALQPDIVVLVINPGRHLIGYKEDLARKENKSGSVGSASTDNHTTIKKYIKMILIEVRSIRKLTQALKMGIGKEYPKLLERYLDFKAEQKLRARKPYSPTDMKLADEIPPECLNEYKSYLRKLIAFFDSHNIRVVLTSYPSLVDRENLEFYKDRPSIFSNRYSPYCSSNGQIDVNEKINSATAEIAISNNLEFIDLDSLLPKTREVFADDVHYTDLGARFVAAEIGDSLTAYEKHAQSKRTIKQ